MSRAPEPGDDVQRLGEVSHVDAPFAPTTPALVGPGVDLSLVTPAGAEHVRRLRHRLRGWLTAQHLPAELVDDILLAVNEAITNVVDHAYSDQRATGQPAPVALSVRRTDASVVVAVADHGTWRTPPSDPGNRGHGLHLIHALARDTRIDTHVGGTTITMDFALPHSTRAR